jgi:RNA polymerase sigma-70 factor (ECF subfamily)
VTWSISAVVIDKMVHVSDRIVRNRAVAEEVVQEVLLRAWMEGDRIRDPNSWLMQVTRRLSLNALRDDLSLRSRHERAAADPFPPSSWSDDPHTVLVRERRRDRLVQAVRELPSPFREFAESVLADGGDATSDLGRRLGLAPGTLASRMSRLRARLRSSAPDLGDAP